MKIFVKVKPNSKHEKVEKIGNAHYVVSVKEPPVEGRANQAVISALAHHLGVSKSRVRIVSGYSSRQKIVEVST